jgi:bifunctional enzyme CysN/CysC
MVEEIMNIVVVGHVDHGKSTVIGHLLADTGSLPKGKLEAIRESCRKNSKPFEYAFLLDALKNEQSQGITIDTCRCFFKTGRRRYIIIDAPGHIEFLKNMVTGASRAEAALMVIDASRGVEENTRRHGYYLSMLGIKQVAVVVNKMDLIDYSEDAYNDIRDEYTKFLSEIGITPKIFIPVSARVGDNIARRTDSMPWYRGQTVLEALDGFENIRPSHALPFRMPVQGVYKFTGSGDSRRIVAGTADSGTARVGDEMVFYPSGKKTRIKSFERFNAPAPEAVSAGEAVGFTMTEEIYVRRGEIACRAEEPAPKVAVRFRANLFWLGKHPLQAGRPYHFKCGTQKIAMSLERVERVVNASTLDRGERQWVDRNEIAECVFTLERPAAFDTTDSMPSTSRFVIVDGYEQAGGGIITEALESTDYDVRNIRSSAGSMTALERRSITGRRGMAVWLTGLSGSGKTTVAQGAERRLLARGIQACVLDGDALRRGLCSDLGFSDADRTENQRRVAEVAAILKNAGVVAIVSTISPLAAHREAARRIIGGDDFLEVYVRASIDVCRARDPKLLYDKQARGGIPRFTGIDSAYEPPEKPDLVIDTEAFGEDCCAEALTGAIEKALRKI